MKFREHRGSFSDSLSTLVEVKDFTGLVEHIRTILKGYNLDIQEQDVKVEIYSKEPDTCLGWDKSFIVTLKKYGVIGFTDSQ